MLRYIAARLAIILPVLLLLLILTFLLSHVLPTDPAVLAAGPNPTAARIAQARHALGLDKPVLDQFGTYVSNLFNGNLGRSFQTKRPITSELGERVMPTLLLVTLSIICSFSLGVGMALWTAGAERGPRALAGRLFGGVGSAMPEYFLGLLFILLFYVVLAVAPVPIGQAGPGGHNVPSVTGAYLIDAIIAGNAGAVGNALGHLVLPVATLALATTAPIYRVARAAIEEAQRARYVDYATLMGCSRHYIRRRVLQNTAPPVLVMTGIIYGLLLGGDVIVETIFSWGGFGQWGIDAITKSNYNAIQAFVLLTALASVLIYLAVDILHALLDPRVRNVI